MQGGSREGMEWGCSREGVEREWGCRGSREGVEWGCREGVEREWREWSGGRE